MAVGNEPSHSRMDVLFTLEPPGSAEFDDPSLEWRRLFSELLGTFFLVVVGAGGGVVAATSDGAISRGAAVTAPALMVMAIILFMGAVSGAHLNPAVTLGFATRRDFPWRRVPGYILMQLVGATLACLFLWAMFGKVGGLGATEPGAGITGLQAMFMEMLLTVGLLSTILGTASRAQNVGPMSAVAVGGACACTAGRNAIWRDFARHFPTPRYVNVRHRHSSGWLRPRPCAPMMHRRRRRSCGSAP